MNPLSRLLLPLLAVLLASCGGGTTEAPALPAPQTAAVDAAQCDDGTAQMVNGQCLRSTTALRAAQAPQATTALTETALFDWAQLTFP